MLLQCYRVHPDPDVHRGQRNRRHRCYRPCYHLDPLVHPDRRVDRCHRGRHPGHRVHQRLRARLHLGAERWCGLASCQGLDVDRPDVDRLDVGLLDVDRPDEHQSELRARCS